MAAPSVGGSRNGTIRFGVFEFDPLTRELTKHGTRLKLQDQPTQILATLLEQPGQIVSREELQRRLWPDGTFVDFDHSLNAAVNKLREALGDSADNPVYIETLARRGYRFLAPVEREGEAAPVASTAVAKRRLWPWVGAIATVALLLASAVVWRLRNAVPTGELRAEVLTSYPGIESGPSLSPDGAKVAFSWNGRQEDNFDIYVKQIGTTGTPLRLTKDPQMDGDPAWSPDDRWIAFVRALTDGSAIMLISPLGGPERKLVEVPGVYNSALSWTPDGKWLGYAAADSPLGPLSIWAISVETGERSRLTSSLGELPGAESRLGDRHPAFSPDGRTLAFARSTRNLVFECYTLRLTRDLRPVGDPVRITDQRYAWVTGIAWSADGSDIVYGAGGLVSEHLWRVPVSGRRPPKHVSFALPAVASPAIARSRPRMADSWRVLNQNLWRMDLKRKERKMLIGSTYWNSRPQYSPDGRKIVFQSNQSGNVEVWTCDVDGSNCHQVTSFGGPQCGTPRWSPDGQWLALDSRTEGQAEIYVIAADGGPPRRMTDHAATDIAPTWSRDGRWIYFASDRTGQYELWKVPKEGGQAVQVTRSGGYIAYESPDGKHIYYTKWVPDSQPQRLFRMPAEGGESTLILPKLANIMDYAVTAKGIYFSPDAKAIQFLDLATGRVSTLAVLEKPLGSLCASPDDAYVVWSQTDKDARDLMLVEGFR